MARQAKNIIWPILKKGNLDEPWFIEFSVRDPLTGKMIRKRISDGFSSINTYEGRLQHGRELIDEYTEKIKNGDFINDNLVDYEDLLLFDSQQRYNNKRRGRLNSVRVLASEFIADKTYEVSQKSLQTYVSKLRLFCDYLRTVSLDDKNITLIGNDQIVSFLKDAVTENSLSRRTVDKYQQLLFSFFKWVIQKKKIAMLNPVLNIPRLGIVVDESAAAIPTEIRRTLQKKIEKHDQQLWLACCMQYYCAIRPGTELRLMKIKQINLDARTITVKNYLAKNSRTEVVDVPQQLYRMLFELDLDSYDQELYLFGDNGKPGLKPLGKNAMRYRFNKFRDGLGLSKEIKYYSWKHSGALELKNSGANMYEIQRHFRHKSVTTTEGYWRKRLGGTGEHIKENFPDI